MNIVVKKVNAPATIEKVESLSLEDMQAIVEGYIEHIDCGDGIDMWLNEEGKLHGLAPNIALVKGGKHLDTVLGNVFFTSSDEWGETTGLSDRQVDKLLRKLGQLYMRVTDVAKGEFVLVQELNL